MFDTHAHINFKRFKGKEDQVVEDALAAGVNNIVVPGTSLDSSKKAVELAKKHSNLHAAIGIHPHHAKDIEEDLESVRKAILTLEPLARDDNTVAIGEIGLDRHHYTKTRHKNYQVDDSFINHQRTILIEQIRLAIEIRKSVILHNREAASDLLAVLETQWESELAGQTVFHCCEPDKQLLEFALDRNVYIGVDGDVTFDKPKQSFVKEVPLEHIVVETDSPFILPEPLKTQKKYPNEPKNIPLIIEAIATLKKLPIDEVVKETTENATMLFSL